MQDVVIDFGIGALTGGLSLSVCWGLFWLIIGLIGFSRGTCSWRVLLNSFVVGLTPVLVAWALFWMRGAVSPSGAPFLVGLSVMPLALAGLGLRSTPDGRRAGSHMLEGVRHLMHELLGKHHDCGGCGHDQDPRRSEGCR